MSFEIVFKRGAFYIRLRRIYSNLNEDLCENERCVRTDSFIPFNFFFFLIILIHARCLKCGVCKTRLNLGNLHSWDKMPYCKVQATSSSPLTISHISRLTSLRLNILSLLMMWLLSIIKRLKVYHILIFEFDQPLCSNKLELNSYSLKTNVATCKGTGEKPTSTTGTF